MIRLRPCVAVLLAVVLLLASLPMAIARTALPLAGQITLCSAGGTVTVGVDASGRPVDPHRLCPDCLPALALPPPAAPDLHHPAREVAAGFAGVVRDEPSRPVTTPRARSPPGPV